MISHLVALILLALSAGAALPHLHLATRDARPIDSRTEALAARLSISGPDAGTDAVLTARVRGRGNSTWFMPKQPYHVELDRPHALLGMPAHRAWSLLANYADKTLLRNLLANFMGARLSFAFTPRNRPVTLDVNGVPLGTFVLTEEVDLAPERLNLPRHDDTGGYVLEIDERRESPHKFETTRQVPYAILRPRAPTDAQLAYIRDYVQHVEDVLAPPALGRDYEDLIDVDSFVDVYLVNEILKNSDAANFSSIFLNKGSGQKLAMGPLWDFDLAAGNIDYTDAQFPTGWWIRTLSPWYRALFTDPAFAARVKARWRELPRLGLDLDGLKAFIDRTVAELGEAPHANFILWPTLDAYVWPNAVVTGSYEGEVDYLKSWLTVRLRWMDMQFK